jgi:hypothetical protein
MLNMLLKKENSMSNTVLVLPSGDSMSHVAVKCAVDITQYMIVITKFIRVIPEEIDVASFWKPKGEGKKESQHHENESADVRSSSTSEADITHKFKRS